MRDKGRLAQRAEYVVVQFLSGMLARSSDRSVATWSRRIGWFSERAFKRRTNLAFENLRRVFPEKSEEQCRGIVSDCWRHFALTTLQFLRTIDQPLEKIAERFDVTGWEHYEAVSASGRGAIIVTAHLGSWEFALSLVTRVKRKITIVARALDNQLLHEKVIRARQRSEVEFVERRKAARSLVRTLEENGLVILVADQAAKKREGVLVPFLGRPAWTTSAPARLSRRFELPIVCVFGRPSADNRFTLEIEPPIFPSGRSVEEITTEMNEVISRQIIRTPELWLWMHNRWKGTPVPSAARDLGGGSSAE